MNALLHRNSAIIFKELAAQLKPEDHVVMMYRYRPSLAFYTQRIPVLYDLVNERVIVGTLDEPLVVPPDAVVVPGVRQVAGEFAAANGIALSTAVIVKYRDERTDGDLLGYRAQARVQIEIGEGDSPAISVFSGGRGSRLGSRAS